MVALLCYRKKQNTIQMRKLRQLLGLKLFLEEMSLGGKVGQIMCKLAWLMAESFASKTY